MGTHCWSCLHFPEFYTLLCATREPKHNAQESFNSCIICTYQYIFPKPTWQLLVYMFKDYTGVLNQLFLFLGRSRCTTRPQTAAFLRSFLPVPISISIPILVYPLWGNAYINEVKAVGKTTENSLHPSAFYLPCHFHISGSEFSPLHFTSNDRQCDSPNLEEKRTFTEWTAFSGFLFSSPKIFTTQEERVCCRLWSRRHRKGSAAAWRRGRRGRKEVWSVTARWIETDFSPQRSKRTRTDRTVLSLHGTYMVKHNGITHLTRRK